MKDYDALVEGHRPRGGGPTPTEVPQGLKSAVQAADNAEMKQPAEGLAVATEDVRVHEERPIGQKREPLKVPYEMRTFSGPAGLVYGLYPIDVSEPPRFQGEMSVKAKPAGPMPSFEMTVRFDIDGAITPAEAYAKFDEAAQLCLPAARQAAAKAWHQQYGTKGHVRGAQRQGLVDAMGRPMRGPV